MVYTKAVESCGHPAVFNFQQQSELVSLPSIRSARYLFEALNIKPRGRTQQELGARLRAASAAMAIHMAHTHERHQKMLDLMQGGVGKALLGGGKSLRRPAVGGNRQKGRQQQGVVAQEQGQDVPAHGSTRKLAPR